MKLSSVWVSILFFLIPALSHAQFFGTDPIGIALSTRAPEPGATVEITLKTFGLNAFSGNVQWFIGGVEQQNLADLQNFEYTAGDIGESTEIEVVLTQPDGVVYEASNTFVVNAVDIIVEAETITPAFYEGRALPSTGSTVHLIAVPITNEDTPAEEYVYQWNVGDDVFSNAPAIGKQAISFVAPGKKDLFVSVDVLKQDGTLVASNKRLIRISKPVLRLYEKNPLRGFSQVSIPDTHLFSQEEMTVRAEPYFMQKNIFSQNPHLEWTVNGRTIENPNENQQELTLLHNREDEEVAIGFSIRNITALTQFAEGGFSLLF